MGLIWEYIGDRVPYLINRPVIRLYGFNVKKSTVYVLTMDTGDEFVEGCGESPELAFSMAMEKWKGNPIGKVIKGAYDAWRAEIRKRLEQENIG